jgi:hypothetical protein
MNWIVFTYSISAQARSSPRVALWRRLRRIGAVSPANGVFVLPARAECIESFQWLAQEIRTAKGQALVMRVEQFEGMGDAELTALFNQARTEEYSQLDGQINALSKTQDRAELQDTLERLRRQHAEISRVDYFACPAGPQTAQRLAQLAERLTSPRSIAPAIPSARIADYRAKTWVTRPRPYVDRLACAWLIRRFINPKATIRYANQPKLNDVAFDMETGEFGHRGNLCTFEVMCQAFNLNEPGLRTITEIVHAIDLSDGRYARSATTGVGAVLDGWHQAKLSDAELEERGSALFEGLLAHFAQSERKPKAPSRSKTRAKSKGAKR